MTFFTVRISHWGDIVKEKKKRGPVRVDFDHSRGSLTLRKIGTILPEDTFSLVFKKATVVQQQSRMECDTFRGGARVWVGEGEKMFNCRNRI